MDNEKHQIDSLDRNDVRVLGGRNVASRYTTGQCLPDRADGTYTLVLKPVEPAIVFEKIVVDYGGYEDSYLFMDESPCRRNKLNGQ